MQITFQLTSNDYYHGLIAWRNIGRWRRWIIPVVVVLGCVAIAVSLIHILRDLNSSTFARFGVALGLLAFWSAIMWAGPRFSAWRQFRTSPSAQIPVTMEVSDSGLHFRSAHADSQVAWAASGAWGEYKSVFVILPQPRIYVPIPKRAFHCRRAP